MNRPKIEKGPNDKQDCEGWIYYYLFIIIYYYLLFIIIYYH